MTELPQVLQVLGAFAAEGQKPLQQVVQLPQDLLLNQPVSGVLSDGYSQTFQRLVPVAVLRQQFWQPLLAERLPAPRHLRVESPVETALVPRAVRDHQQVDRLIRQPRERDPLRNTEQEAAGCDDTGTEPVDRVFERLQVFAAAPQVISLISPLDGESGLERRCIPGSP